MPKPVKVTGSSSSVTKSFVDGPFLAEVLWEWLRTLAGNTFASEDEMRGPYQRALGRRAAVVCLIIAACVLAMTASTAVAAALFGEGSPKFDLLVRASAYVTTVVVGVSCVILCVVQWREHRANERAERADDPGLETDSKIEARQAIALVVIVVALEVVLPVAASASSHNRRRIPKRQMGAGACLLPRDRGAQPRRKR
ncbi:MAG: hypothetical protein U0L71_06680 [Eggerthellaceae bacterium]|nr:hypothetical protein [Eggerthellaceae bacterium]